MRQGRRQFRPDVAGLEDRQLLSAVPSPLATVASFGATNTVISAPVLDAKGDLFGTTSAGGVGQGKGIGTVYEIPAGSNKAETLASFDGRTGYGISGVTLDARGNLYGTIAGEGGTIGNGSAFEIAAGTKVVTPIASFNGDGEFPQGLVTDAQGNHFGTAAVGGVDGTASVYEIPAGSNTITPIASFNGAAPAPKGVVIDAQGNLYGTNQGGGAYGIGSVYEVARGSNTITTLASFSGLNGPGISNPTLDARGDVYGTTDEGGQYGLGTVFEIPKGSNTAVALAAFDGPNGSSPDAAAGVVRDAQGNLYGITRTGGAHGYGTIFEVPAGSNAVTTLVNFTNDRQSLVTGLLLDGLGDLVGTTEGGPGFAGTVFKVALNSLPAKV